MTKRNNTCYTASAKGLTLALISFITFYFILNKTPVDVFLGVYTVITAIILLSVGTCKNIRMLLSSMLSGISIMAGHVLAKLACGCAIESMISHMTFIRILLLIGILIEYTIIFWLWHASAAMKQQRRLHGKSGERLELFPERTDDLERLRKYLETFGVVGVNGSWGSGKTFLVDEFTRRDRDQYEVIKVEPLTCNMDKIDAYLFKKLENVLWKNRIYPEYSRRLQRLMANSGWTDKIYGTLYPDASSDLTAFEGFCADLDKLENPILLVYEDLDRISDENKDQIAKLLDLTAKLLQHNVKVIYEFDLKKMAALGYGYDYIEKYIPYTMNLTPVSGKKLIKKALAELDNVNKDLSSEDFDYLFVYFSIERFLQETFGFPLKLQLSMNNPTPRKVKQFVSEVNSTVGSGQYADKKNWRTVITFYFMKHFFRGIYDELAFEGDMIDEIRLVLPSEDSDLEMSYTVMELVAGCKLGEARSTAIPGEEDRYEYGLVSEDIKRMLLEGRSARKNQIVRQNRNKLGLLILMGYKFKYQQDEADQEILMQRDAANAEAGKRSGNVLLNQDKELIKNIEYNKKISRLIKNLYANGQSEFTNAEAIAQVFISDVLEEDQRPREKRWQEFLVRARQGNLIKDNRTVFRWGENDWVSLFRALNIYVDRDTFVPSDKEEIIERALDFYFAFSDNDELDFDKIVIFNYCSIDSNKIFIKVLERFRNLKITGNMNGEKAYRDFLREYSRHAMKKGYLQRYDFFKLELPIGGYSERYSGVLREYLEECVRQVEGTLKEGLYPARGKQELELVKDFYERNIEVVDSLAEAKQTRMSIVTTIRSEEEYIDEEEFKNLSKYVPKGSDGAAENQVTREEFTAMLEESYNGGKIDLRRYSKLLRDFLNTEKNV